MTRLVLAAGLALAMAAPATAKDVCKPEIAFKEVRTTYQPGPRAWTAVLAVDDSRCATTSGRFELFLMRAKEYSADLRFVEPAIWQAGQTQVTLELSDDEVISEFGIRNILPCPCRAPQAK